MAWEKDLGTYKGNADNLMQHWTLCELLGIAGKRTSGLSFIDAHAMGPLARERTHHSPLFSRVQSRLPGQRSVYERVWHQLAPNEGYPNSAAFVTGLWSGDFSLLLCETDHLTIAALRTWLDHVQDSGRCRSAELFPSDWRERFGEGLPSASEMELADGSLTLVSFDPYMYNSQRRFDDPKKRKKGNLYPDDIERAIGAMNSLRGGTLIQLSTYDTNDSNPREAVISSVDSILTASNFTRRAVVSANNKMMSLVYARDVSWSDELESLPQRFEKWRAAITDS